MKNPKLERDYCGDHPRPQGRKGRSGRPRSSRIRDREKALSGNDLPKLAQESGVTVNVTRPFTTGEVLPEVGQAPEFYKNALSLNPKDISPVIEGPNAYYVLKIKQRSEPTIPPFDAVRSNIEKSLKESKAHEMLQLKEKVCWSN